MSDVGPLKRARRGCCGGTGWLGGGRLPQDLKQRLQLGAVRRRAALQAAQTGPACGRAAQHATAPGSLGQQRLRLVARLRILG